MEYINSQEFRFPQEESIGIRRIHRKFGFLGRKVCNSQFFCMRKLFLWEMIFSEEKIYPNVKGVIIMAERKMAAKTAAKAEAAKEEAKKTEVKAEEIKTADIKAETQKEDLETPKTEEKKKAAPRKSTAKKAETKITAKRAVKKEIAKAAAEKAVAAEKKVVARKSAAPKKEEIKEVVHFEFAGRSYTQDDLLKSCRDVWKYDLNGKEEDIKSVELYVKPEENTTYYVINGEIKGNFAI